MHESIFSYNVTRQYPLKWFTWTVVIGGVVLTVLFSFLNLSANGFILTTQSTDNPNSTFTNYYYNQLPSFLGSKLTASCAPAIIPVNSNPLTNNSAITYTLNSVTSEDDQNQPSLTYLGNIIQECEVGTIVVFMEGPYARTAAQIGERDWGVNLMAQITCKLQLFSPGLTTINLTASWDPLPPTVSTYGVQLFLGTDKVNKASLYWGEALLMGGWMALIQNVWEEHDSPLLPAPFLKAEATLKKTGLTYDVFNTSFYAVSFRGITYLVDGNFSTGSGIILDGYTATEGSNNTSPDQPLSQLLDPPEAPNIWHNVDLLAKTFESAILTDLGQQDIEWNILTNVSLVKDFALTFVSQLTGIYVPIWSNYNILAQVAFAAELDTDMNLNMSGPLAVSRSVFSATYLCDVPTRKPAGNLVLSILVADLVLLQAAWVVFRFIVDYFVKRKDESANYCKGCLERGRDPDETATETGAAETKSFLDGSLVSE